MPWWAHIPYVLWVIALVYSCAKGYTGRGWFYMPEQHCCHKEDK